MRAHDVAREGREALATFRPTTRLQSISLRLWRRHTEYIELLCDFFAKKAEGDGEGAIEAMERMKRVFGACEWDIEGYYDQFLLIDALMQIAYENNHGF